MYKVLMFSALLLLPSLRARAQTSDSDRYKFFVGSTLFVLYNTIDDPEPPQYYQLNIGYRISSKDILSLELITWRYFKPLGIPHAKVSEAAGFPGSVQAFGAGLAYKRFLWKSVYAQVHTTLLHQNYLDHASNTLQTGMQLFNTIRAGYQFRFFKNSLFLEPSLAMTFWPVNTNLPDTFQKEEDKWNSFFIGEPGLHFGYNF